MNTTQGTLPDYYAILGVSPTASLDALKAAYKQKVLETHPDRNPGLADANERVRMVIEAWAFLSNPENRRKYDEARASHNAVVEAQVRENIHRAEEQAAAFPEKWDQFQEWQKDYWPELVQTKRVTPRLIFILGGSIITAWILYGWLSPNLATTWFGGLRDQFPNLWFWFWYWCFLSFCLPLFANLANALSSQFPSLARPKPQQKATSASPPPNRIYHVACSGCGVTLRFPRLGKMRVTCPKCGTQQILS